MRDGVDIKVAGAKDVNKVLQRLPQRVQKNIFRSAIRAATRPVIKDARKALYKQGSVRSKSLWKSITAIVKTYKNGTVGAFVGPSRKYRGTHNGKRVTPWKYAHLVERGGDGGRLRPRPFLAPAIAGKLTATKNAFAQQIRKRLPVEIAKLKRK